MCVVRLTNESDAMVRYLCNQKGFYITQPTATTRHTKTCYNLSRFSPTIDVINAQIKIKNTLKT